MDDTLFCLVNESGQTYHRDGRWGPILPKHVVTFPTQLAAKQFLRNQRIKANVRAYQDP